MPLYVSFSLSNLDSAGIGEKEIDIIARSLKESQALNELSLSNYYLHIFVDWNYIGVREAQYLAEALKFNQTMSILNLGISISYL